MTALVYTAMRNQLLDGGSLKTALAAGFINIYTGTPPVTADAATTGTLLCIISLASSGTGINLGTSSAGSIPKATAESWSGVNVASGTAGYFRWVAPGDDGTLSTLQKRLQGSCGMSGADLNMSSINLVNGATQTIDSSSITMPASA
jgi:hypothetical protein